MYPSHNPPQVQLLFDWHVTSQSTSRVSVVWVVDVFEWTTQMEVSLFKRRLHVYIMAVYLDFDVVSKHLLTRTSLWTTG